MASPLPLSSPPLLMALPLRKELRFIFVASLIEFMYVYLYKRICTYLIS